MSGIKILKHFYEELQLEMVYGFTSIILKTNGSQSKADWSKTKVMPMVFWDAQGLLIFFFLESQKTIIPAQNKTVF